MIWLVLALQDYAINGRPCSQPAELSALPQSPRITIDFTRAPVGEVFAEVSKQSGVPLRWKGALDKAITISARNAPLLAVVAEMAMTLECNLSEVSTAEGRVLQLPASFFNGPVKAYQVRGSAILVWYGLTSWEKYNFDNPREPVKTTRYAMSLLFDRRGQAHAFRAREIPVSFTIDGKKEAIRSDHDPNVFSSDGITWEFDSKKLSGARATVEVTVPCRAPSETRSVIVSLSEPHSAKAAGTIVSVENYRREDKGVRVDYAATLRLAPAKNNPSASPELYALYFHGPGRGRVAAAFERRAREYVLAQMMRDMEFKPAELEIVWTQNPKEFNLPFSLEVPLK